MISLLVLAAVSGSAVSARPFTLKGGAHQVSYEYSWPSEARAIPRLQAQLLKQMRNDRAEIIGMAKESRGDEWFEKGVGYQSTFTYELNGQSGRLLSLSGRQWQFTGGAHGNGSSIPLLWDKMQNREMTILQLFARPTEYALLAPIYCNGLEHERKEKRGGDGKLRTLPEFDECPKLSELSVELVDENQNHRFDHLRFTADPYVAGPYAEGEYTVDLPVTPRLIGGLKPEYRSSFEIQRQ
jgi:hypothetical protein